MSMLAIKQMCWAEVLGGMKHAAQARDRELVERGEVPPESMIMLRAERIKGLVIEWPEDSLLDDPQ